MAKKKLQDHTLTAVSLTQLMRLWGMYGVSPAYYPRFAHLAFTSVLALPLRLIDTLRSSGAVRRSRLEQAPVFVVGHPRSGTTHLHNLLCQDERFGCATTFHCGATEMFLGLPSAVRMFMQGMLPESRPMDNVKVGLDEPQEEEMAMARISAFSFNHGLHFPAKAREIFDRCVTFEAGSSQDELRWKSDYDWFLRRINIDQGGRQLCLKSPPNTARIRQLLDLFPEARFIHVYRNPYVVYASVQALWRKVLPLLALQRYKADDVEEILVYFFQRMIQRFYEDQPNVPEGQVTEVRFEDLEADPIGELERVYADVQLDGFDTVRPALQRYIDSLAGYRKNRYEFEASVIRRVEDQWGFALERWKYDPPTE
ncbi:MAG: sulfotransferase [Pirellulaceae bacterium]